MALRSVRAAALSAALLLQAAGALRTQANESFSRIYFLHIAKTAGKSARTDLRSHAPAQGFTAHECCWPNLTRPADPPWDVITFVREPLAHVYSQWTHCHRNLENWFNPHDMPGTFVEWLQHWARVGDKPSSANHSFHCYLPINLQARALSCQAFPCPMATPGLDTDVLTDTSGKLAVREQVALQRVSNATRGAAFVGLTDFYQESMCLVHVKYKNSYPAYCDCEDAEAWASFSATRYTHGSQTPISHGKSLSRLEAQLVRQLTAVDQRIYQAATRRFMAEVAEVERRFGKKLLCESSLRFARDTEEGGMLLYPWDEIEAPGERE